MCWQTGRMQLLGPGQGPSIVWHTSLTRKLSMLVRQGCKAALCQTLADPHAGLGGTNEEWGGGAASTASTVVQTEPLC